MAHPLIILNISVAHIHTHTEIHAHTLNLPITSTTPSCKYSGGSPQTVSVWDSVILEVP